MPKGMTAADVVKYETEELGNVITPEGGVDLFSVKSDNLQWLTETSSAAKQYGQAAPVIGNFRVIARDPFKGVLVELLSSSPSPNDAKKKRS